MNTYRALCFCILALSLTMFGQQQAAVQLQTLTDAMIVQMVQSHMSPDLIMLAISKCDPHFALDPASTTYMLQNGVSEDIIKAMAAKQMGQPIPGYAQGAPAQSAPVALPSAPSTLPKKSDDDYLHHGSAEIDLSATAIIPHSSVSDTLAEVSFGAGYHVTRGHTVGVNMVGIFVNGGQDIFLSGFYRYYVHTGNPKLYPFFGGGAGANILHISGEGSAHNFLVRGEAGIRYFLAPHVALDTAYNLVYVHVSGVPFKYSSYSQVGVGLATVF